MEDILSRWSYLADIYSFRLLESWKSLVLREAQDLSGRA